MSVLVVGTTALDSIRTPYQEKPKLLGGSASHAAVAASFFAPVSLVGVIGDDFPAPYVQLYQEHNIDLQGLERKPGRTFFWEGEYEVNMNRRRTNETVLGVIENWLPDLPEPLRRKPFVLLANCEPKLQLHILNQIHDPRFVVADTMDLWLNIARDDLLALLKKIDALILNDTEARQLTEEDNLPVAIRQIHELGPRYVIVKKGEHGAMLSGPQELFLAAAYPLTELVDPTGAGDSFIGGLTGYLAEQGGEIERHLRQAVVYGSAVASFCCQGFGLAATEKLDKVRIEERVAEIENFVRFELPERPETNPRHR